MIGSVDTSLGSVETSGPSGQSGGSGPSTGVQSVTGIVPGLVDNTDPLNPIILQQGTVQSVTGASVDNADPANPVVVDPFLLELGYGHGIAGTDDTLPAVGFWFDQATDADHAIGAGTQVNEWEVGATYGWVALDVYVYRATILDDEFPSVCKLAVTVDGVATGAFVTLSSGSITNTRHDGRQDRPDRRSIRLRSGCGPVAAAGRGRSVVRGQQYERATRRALRAGERAGGPGYGVLGRRPLHRPRAAYVLRGRPAGGGWR
jgi:hypothetical protein